jgi:GxxExxY protein
MPLLPISTVQALARGIMADLGAGYSEAIYRNALWKELLTYDQRTVIEQTVPILFRGQFLGTCRADIVTTQYVIEIKALKTVLPCVGHQIKKYIKHLAEVEPDSTRTGLVINFNQQTEVIDFLLFQQPITPPSLPNAAVKYELHAMVEHDPTRNGTHVPN